MKKRKIVLKLVSINCINTGKDPGRELEIYGNLFCRVSNKNITLWNASRNNQVGIKKNESYDINKEYEIIIKEFQIINKKEVINLSGELYEADNISADDKMTGENLIIPVDEVSTAVLDKSIEFKSGKQVVEVKYEIKCVE